ncbi:MAG TPA: GyrI-like domain-containing protein [bacterium]|nr:GyrI-like domain-containing protein [bacterium]
MEPRLVERKEMRVVGLRTRTRQLNEANLKGARIPALWDRFLTERSGARIKHRLDPDVVLGVYSAYENDYLGEYDLLVGAQVGEIDTPPGFSSLIILPSKYLVFKAKGQMPRAVSQTWAEIWDYFADSRHPERRAYTADFEWYHAAKPSEVDIFVSVK